MQGYAKKCFETKDALLDDDEELLLGAGVYEKEW